ncbi:MAG: CDGSH iron-sulfur domain-containing protein [Pseudomonadota bacterium]|nr:CDGSH iron-sulfur domain-containing protein [Pseudomonadota bacterium]
MTKPIIAQKTPYMRTVQPGTYWWCACGRSQDQPFCDGSHKDSDLAPVKVVVTEPQEIAFCGCKYTQNPPYCDGSHDKI